MNPSILELTRMYALKQFIESWTGSDEELYLLGAVRAVREAHQ